MPDAPSTDPTRPAAAGAPGPDEATNPAAAADAGAFRGSPPPPTSDGSRPARRRLAVVLPWVVAILALGATAFSTWQWQQLAAQEGQADSARAAALSFVQDLTNWDAADGLDDEIETLRDQGTGPFLEEIDAVFGGDALTSQLQQAEVAATSEVEEAFVQDLGNGTAEVFVVVSVTYQAPGMQQEPQPVIFPAQIVLEQQGDGWLVRRVSVPNSDQIGQLMAPTPAPPTDSPTEG